MACCGQENDGVRSTLDRTPPSKTSRKQARQNTDGITVDTPSGSKKYACIKCIKGHRVAKCSLEHAVTRPMLPTNEPGRPSSGTQKRNCDCPKSCDCQGSCKCSKECNCVRTMFMLVYVPSHRLFHHKEEVECDSLGNRLSAKEVDARKQRKRQLQSHARKSRSSSTNGGLNSSLSAFSEEFSEDTPRATPATSPGQLDEHYNTIQPAKKSCCHSKNIEEQEIEVKVDHTSSMPSPTSIPPQSVKGCNCGDTCSCSFCPEHPNNRTSRDAIKQQYADIFATGHPTELGLEVSTQLLESNTGPSCMGSNPRFTISSTPTLSAESLRRMFRSGQDQEGFIMSYPVTWQRSQTPNPDFPSLQNANSFPVLAIGMQNGFGVDQSEYPSIGVPHQDNFHDAELDQLLSNDISINGFDFNDPAMSQLDQWNWQIGPSVVSSVSMNDFDLFQNVEGLQSPTTHHSLAPAAEPFHEVQFAYSNAAHANVRRHVPALTDLGSLTMNPTLMNQIPSGQPSISPIGQDLMCNSNIELELDFTIPRTHAKFDEFSHQQLLSPTMPILAADQNAPGHPPVVTSPS